MLLLDHLVHFVEKPERLVETTKEFGLHTVNGGKHEIWGTYNSLCYFGLSYIEFIGIFDEALFEKAAQEPFTLHESYKKQNYQNGVVRIVLRTDAIEKVAENLHSTGYEVHGPEEFSRTRPDGSVLKWNLLHFGKEGQNLDFPFVIQWDAEDDVRLQGLIESGSIKPHPLGNLQIEEIEFEVEDLAIAADWESAFNFEVEGTDTYKKLKLPNASVTFKKTSGSSKISKVILTGAQEEKEVVLEGTKYHFQK